MLRVLELYAGIGGAAAALEGLGIEHQGVGAIDIDREALAVYEANFRHPTVVKLFDSIPTAWLASREADLWWASPPCQPFTRRGRRRGLDDPRAATFRALLRELDAVRPPALAFENVVGFETSEARAELIRVLDAAGYAWRETLICPSELGVPNRRPRYYLAASRRGEPTAFDRRPVRPTITVADCLDPDVDTEALRLEPDLAKRYRGALHVVDAAEIDAVTHCFTSAYGRSPVRSGSYLRLADQGLRRFSPREILRFLGFPSRYALPASSSCSRAWRLVGNSLALEPVRRLLATLPDVALPRRLHHEDSPC